MYLNLSEYKQTPKQGCLGVSVCVVFCRRGKHTRFPGLLIIENLTDSIIAVMGNDIKTN